MEPQAEASKQAAGGAVDLRRLHYSLGHAAAEIHRVQGSTEEWLICRPETPPMHRRSACSLALIVQPPSDMKASGHSMPRVQRCMGDDCVRCYALFRATQPRGMPGDEMIAVRASRSAAAAAVVRPTQPCKGRAASTRRFWPHVSPPRVAPLLPYGGLQLQNRVACRQGQIQLLLRVCSGFSEDVKRHLATRQRQQHAPSTGRGGGSGAGLSRPLSSPSAAESVSLARVHLNDLRSSSCTAPGGRGALRAVRLGPIRRSHAPHYCRQEYLSRLRGLATRQAR